MLGSLERGFNVQSVAYELNPRRLGSSFSAVGVLSDLDALAAAIEWKVSNQGGRLVVGPDVFVVPSEDEALISAPEIDLLLVPSDWVRDRFAEEAPGVAEKLRVWAAGVDTGYWSPAALPDAHGPNRRHALIYLKEIPHHRNATGEDLAVARNALEKEGFTSELVRYGEYSTAEFRDALRRSDVMVAFTPTETQGMALLEAWSTGVPTLVAPVGETIFKGRNYRSSSAPYLTDETGLEFGDVDELVAGLGLVRAGRWEAQRPRRWVLENMTDEETSRRYLELALGNLP